MMGNVFYFEWEIQLMIWLQKLAGSFGAAVSSFFTYFGEELAIVAVLGLVYWCYDKEFGRFLGVSICIGIVSNALVKNIFLRRRPYLDNPDIKCLKPAEKSADIYDVAGQGFSFPSGHATNSTILYGGIGAYKKSWQFVVPGVALIILVSVSRVILGVHYPTDVLVGIVMGICVLLLSSFLLKNVKKRWLLYLIVFLVSCIGIFYCRTNDYYTSLGIMGGFFLGDLFEEKFVRFENTRVWYRFVLRTVGGLALFFVFNTLLKLPFSKEFLESGTTAAFVIRCVRYFIDTFVIIGLYPKAFTSKKGE